MAWPGWGFRLGPGYGVGPYSSDCVLDKSANVSDNKVFTATGDATICGRPWAKYFGPGYAGRDHNSTVAKYPTDEELVGWAEELLGFAQ